MSKEINWERVENYFLVAFGFVAGILFTSMYYTATYVPISDGVDAGCIEYFIDKEDDNKKKYRWVKPELPATTESTTLQK